MKRRNLKKFILCILALFLCLAAPLQTFADEQTENTTPETVAGNTEGPLDNPEAAAGDTLASAATYASTFTWPTPPATRGKSVVLMEISTGTMLHELDTQTRRYPASTTKILTAMVVLEHCHMDETVTFSENAVTLEYDASSIGAVAGEEMKLQDVLYGCLISSGNECANALAEHVAGSYEAFAELMNEKAKELGALNSHFVNPSGLYDDNHYTTAYDMALIARAAYQNSTFLNIISTTSYTIPPTNMDDYTKELKNTNELIQPNSDYYYEYAIGGKTGYLDQSGRCLVAYAKKDNMAVLVVDYQGGFEKIFGEVRDLFEYAFNNFTLINISEKEKRFAFSDNDAKLKLDPTSQMVTLKNVPFELLESSVVFADSLSDEQVNELLENKDLSLGQSLYARISYSLGGQSLGNLLIFTDPSVSVKSASFIPVIYLNYLHLAIGLAVIIILLIIAAPKGKKRQQY